MQNHAVFCIGSDRQRGLSLVELMVAMTVGLLVMGVATTILIGVKSAYVEQADSAQILDTGRHAMELLSRTVRQASYLDWDLADTSAAITPPEEPAIYGLDAKSLKSRTAGIEAPVTRSINGSDVLVVRFAGSGQGSNGDGSVLNCAGFPVGTEEGESTKDRGWSIFYVAEDASGVPELYCKYPGEDGWSSQAIARGVESFQVLYALDIDSDGYPNTFVTASQVEAMSKGSPGKQAYWKNVVAIKVAMLVHGASPVHGEKQNRQYDLFGPAYSASHAGRDKGTKILVSELPKPVRSRARKVFTATIWLRNRAIGV